MTPTDWRHLASWLVFAALAVLTWRFAAHGNRGARTPGGSRE